MIRGFVELEPRAVVYPCWTVSAGLVWMKKYVKSFTSITCETFHNHFCYLCTWISGSWDGILKKVFGDCYATPRRFLSFLADVVLIR